MTPVFLPSFLALSLIAAAPDLPVTGRSDPGLQSFDRLMTEFVREHQAPGAALAVTRHGKLVYARGFGYADVEAKEHVRPTSLFRIASVSKPITAVALLHLAETKKLNLGDRVVDHLGIKPYLEAGAKQDPRWRNVTLIQVLQHTGGWDRDTSYDPMFRPLLIAKTLGTPPPAGADDVVRYMLGQPLDFDPGSRYAYSNFGYCLLGRVIEHVSGEKYETYVRDHVLAPIGIRDMRIGRTLKEGRFPGEVVYYDEKKRTGKAVVGPWGQVPLPYGAWNLEAMDAHGGWVASAVDLARFAAALDDPAHCPVLRPASMATLFGRPDGPAGLNKKGKPAAEYYACGWEVRPGAKGQAPTTWHSGALDGTGSLVVRRSDGINWVVLFNGQSDAKGRSLTELIDGRLHEAADAVKSWPEGNLFTQFP